jgi:hypothetical protein
VFPIKPTEHPIQANLGVGGFITVGLAELISNPLCYSEMVTALLFHEKLLDPPLSLFGIFQCVGYMEHFFYTLPNLAHCASPQQKRRA